MSWFAFDADFYRATYPDLRNLGDEDAKAHYNVFGIAEGRLASKFGTRQTFLDQIDPKDRVLEIGPYVSPLMTGENVKYLDILSREKLHERAISDGLDVTMIPRTIDFVGDISQIETKFDTVISSHSIEHQPDLISHLQQVGRILSPGGHYFLMIPDKRYCFDHFIPESTIAGVLQANVELRRLHTLGSIIEHVALTTHSDAVRHWKADHGAICGDDRITKIDAAVELFDRNPGGYIDVHAWYFTPMTFFNITDILYRRGMVTLRPSVIFPTTLNTSEFFAVLVQNV